MKRKFTFLLLSLTLVLFNVSAQLTTDGLYTIQCVGSSKYMTNPGGPAGDIVEMSTSSGDVIKFYIVENAATSGKYNIITKDQVYLVASDGSKGVLMDNTETNRNSDGALVDLLDEGANPYRIESYPGGDQKAWNGQRTKVNGLGTQVGMGTSVSNQYQWNLTRVGDMPELEGRFNIFSDLNNKYMTNPGGGANDIVEMQTSGAIELYILENNQTPGKYNIITPDDQFIVASDGSKAILLDNTAANRNDNGALVEFVSHKGDYFITSNPGGVFKRWNARRTGGTQVGMGTSDIGGYNWELNRLGDLPVVPTSNIVINGPNPIEFPMDENRYMQFTIEPYNATNKDVNWVSSDPAIATVNSSGRVSGVSIGIVTITGTTVSGNHVASLTVKTTKASGAPPVPVSPWTIVLSIMLIAGTVVFRHTKKIRVNKAN